MLFDDVAANFLGRCDLTAVLRKFPGQQGKGLDRFIARQVGRLLIDTVAKKGDDLRVLYQFFPGPEGDALFPGDIFDGLERGHDQGTDEFTAVANGGDLFDIVIFAHGGFDALRGNVFSIIQLFGPN